MVWDTQRRLRCSEACVSTIVSLRILAIISNVLFALYGVLAHLYPVFLLHSILLPVNVFKLARMKRLALGDRSARPRGSQI
jgi:hypothetical protein